MKMIIKTQAGRDYTVNEHGYIVQGDPPKFSYSGQWKLVGLMRSYHGRLTNDFIPFSIMTPEVIKELQLTYKNGKGQYHVRDLDHGTHRLWNDPVKYIVFE